MLVFLLKNAWETHYFVFENWLFLTVGSRYKWNLSSADSNENDIRNEHCQRQRKATISLYIALGKEYSCEYDIISISVKKLDWGFR